MSSKINIINSYNFENIQNYCSETQYYTLLNFIIGSTGQGKTIGIKHYADSHEDVYYIKIKKSMTPKIIICRLLEQFGENPDYAIGIHYNLDLLTRHLNSNNRKKLIIFDEACKMTALSFLYIHELRDDTDHTTGMILASPDSIEKKFKNWINNKAVGMEEFHRRITDKIYLEEPTEEEIRSVIEENDINDEEFILECQVNCRKFSDIEQAIILFKREQSRKNRKRNKDEDENIGDDKKAS